MRSPSTTIESARLGVAALLDRPSHRATIGSKPRVQALTDGSVMIRKAEVPLAERMCNRCEKDCPDVLAGIEERRAPLGDAQVHRDDASAVRTRMTLVEREQKRGLSYPAHSG